MKRLFLLLSLVLFSTGVAADRSMITLSNPSMLDPLQLQVSLIHRFRGPVDHDSFETFFGLHEGANVGTAFRFCILKHFEAKTHYFYPTREASVGLSYSFYLKRIHVNTQLEAHWLTTREIGQDRENGFFFLAALETDPLLKRMAFLINLGYDEILNHWGAGIGLDFSILKSLILMGEFYPVFDQNNALDQHGYAFGVKIRTYGHQFVLQLSNGGRAAGPDLGVRRMMAGASDQRLYLGFTIHRLFDF